jgi:hypothetical protein
VGNPPCSPDRLPVVVAAVRPPQLAAFFVVPDSWALAAVRKVRLPFKIRLNIGVHTFLMRVAMATVVALLILNFVDEHFNDARYTRASKAMLSHIARSFG